LEQNTGLRDNSIYDAHGKNFIMVWLLKGDLNESYGNLIQKLALRYFLWVMDTLS
jgi:hypothetical protein